MRLATLRNDDRDGCLVVVDRGLVRAVAVSDIAPTLQYALDHWPEVAPALADLSARLDEGDLPHTIRFDPADARAPLPRAYQFLDGSAYLAHVELARAARGAAMPERLYVEPLMYQGCSDTFLGPTEPIPLADPTWGLDFEAELAVVTGDVPLAAGPAEAERLIRLVLLMNDVSLRALIPDELAKGFGFLHGKPPSSFAPVALTPDELGPAWNGRRLSGRVRAMVNGKLVGAPDCGVDLQFDFAQLIAHAARTRPLSAGTIIGSGTISNRDRSRGSACLVERRMLEQLDRGEPRTPWLAWGDRVRIDMPGPGGRSPFGAIDQEVVRSRR